MKPCHKQLSLLGLSLLVSFAPPATAALPTSTPLGSLSDSLQAPSRLAAGADGSLYVVDPAKNQVVTFDAFGRKVSIRQGFARPASIAVAADGTVFVGEEQAGSVSAFDANWNRLYKLGLGDGEFVLPNHLCVDPEPGAGRVFVCDGRANEIRAYVNGTQTSRFGSLGAWEGQFRFPAGVFVSTGGSVFVVDQGNDRIQVFDRAGTFQRSFNLGGGMGMGASGRSQGITGDSAGRLYVADSFQGWVKVFSETGSSLGIIGGFGEGKGLLQSPVGVVIDPLNRLCVASANNGRVELIGLDDFLHVSAAPARRFVAVGTEARLTVAVGSSGPVTYEWIRNGSSLAEGDRVTGSHSASLAISGTTTNDTGNYAVSVTGSFGTRTSPALPLVVLTPPAIDSMTSNQTVLPGTSLTLAAAASGNELSFQWLRNGTDIPGANATTLPLTQVSREDMGRYTFIASNAVGVARETLFLTVRVPPYAPVINALGFLPDGRTQFRLDAEPDCPFAIFGSPDMSSWSTLTNVVNQAGTVEFTDPQPGVNRFYKVGWLRW